MIFSVIGIAIIVIFVVLLFILVKEVYFIHHLKQCGHICCKCEYANECHCDKPPKDTEVDTPKAEESAIDPDEYMYRETDNPDDMYK